MAYPPYTGYNFVSPLHHDIYPAINPTKAELSQSSKVVVITGAGRGIGCSIALNYASCSVSTIVLCSRTLSELTSVESAIKTLNASIRIHKVPLDVTDEPSVQALASLLQKQESRLDILVNNAGTGDPWVPIADTVADNYWRTLTVNLKGPYLLIKHLLPLMVATAKEHATRTDIVNISSIGANVVLPTGPATRSRNWR
jgi:NAD(P)-dependent dehydrogenase (short-subunit alcohol dehydrogenase family)